MNLIKNLSFLIMIGLYITNSNKQPSSNAIKAYEHKNINIKGRLSISEYLGIKYMWGGNSKKGTDCSGLIKMFYDEKLNVTLPRTAQTMSYLGEEIKIDSIEKYDLLFFSSQHNKITHVAMYLGDNKIIQAVSKGSQIDSIGSRIWNKYWKRQFVKAKRVI